MIPSLPSVSKYPKPIFHALEISLEKKSKMACLKVQYSTLYFNGPNLFSFPPQPPRVSFLHEQQLTCSVFVLRAGIIIGSLSTEGRGWGKRGKGGEGIGLEENLHLWSSNYRARPRSHVTWSRVIGPGSQTPKTFDDFCPISLRYFIHGVTDSRLQSFYIQVCSSTFCDSVWEEQWPDWWQFSIRGRWMWFPVWVFGFERCSWCGYVYF